MYSNFQLDNHNFHEEMRNVQNYRDNMDNDTILQVIVVYFMQNFWQSYVFAKHLSNLKDNVTLSLRMHNVTTPKRVHVIMRLTSHVHTKLNQ